MKNDNISTMNRGPDQNPGSSGVDFTASAFSGLSRSRTGVQAAPVLDSSPGLPRTASADPLDDLFNDLGDEFAAASSPTSSPTSPAPVAAKESWGAWGDRRLARLGRSARHETFTAIDRTILIKDWLSSYISRDTVKAIAKHAFTVEPTDAQYDQISSRAFSLLERTRVFGRPATEWVTGMVLGSTTKFAARHLLVAGGVWGYGVAAGVGAIGGAVGAGYRDIHKQARERIAAETDPAEKDKLEKSVLKGNLRRLKEAQKGRLAKNMLTGGITGAVGGVLGASFHDYIIESEFVQSKLSAVGSVLKGIAAPVVGRAQELVGGVNAITSAVTESFKSPMERLSPEMQELLQSTDAVLYEKTLADSYSANIPGYIDKVVGNRPNIPKEAFVTNHDQISVSGGNALRALLDQKAAYFYISAASELDQSSPNSANLNAISVKAREALDVWLKSPEGIDETAKVVDEATTKAYKQITEAITPTTGMSPEQIAQKTKEISDFMKTPDYQANISTAISGISRHVTGLEATKEGIAPYIETINPDNANIIKSSAYVAVSDLVKAKWDELYLQDAIKSGIPASNNFSAPVHKDMEAWYASKEGLDAISKAAREGAEQSYKQLLNAAKAQTEELLNTQQDLGAEAPSVNVDAIKPSVFTEKTAFSLPQGSNSWTELSNYTGIKDPAKLKAMTEIFLAENKLTATNVPAGKQLSLEGVNKFLHGIPAVQTPVPTDNIPVPSGVTETITIPQDTTVGEILGSNWNAVHDAPMMGEFIKLNFDDLLKTYEGAFGVGSFPIKKDELETLIAQARSGDASAAAAYDKLKKASRFIIAGRQYIIPKIK